MEEVDVSHEALVRELSDASLESHKIAAVMCVYRVLPLLQRRTETGTAVEVPTERWSRGVMEGEVFSVLDALRAGVDSEVNDESLEEDDEIQEIFAMASEMVLRAFAEDLEVPRWSDWCSSLCLDIHQAFDALAEDADLEPQFYPAGQYPDLTELQACELEDQVRILRLLRHRSPANDAKVMDIADAGQARIAASLGRVLDAES